MKGCLVGSQLSGTSRLTEATKEDDLLAKTINKPQRARKGGYGSRNKNKGLFLLFLNIHPLSLSFQERRGQDPDLGPGLGEGPDLGLIRGPPRGDLVPGLAREVVATTGMVQRRTGLGVTPRMQRRRSRRMVTLPSLRIISQVRIFPSFPLPHFLRHGIRIFSLLLLCS